MAAVVKIKRSSVQNRVPTTSQIEAGELALNTRDGVLYSTGSSVFQVGANTQNQNITNDLTVGNDITVTNDILPSSNNVSNIGSTTKRFNELFLSGSTINLGGATLSSDGTGTLSISAAVLPGSRFKSMTLHKQNWRHLMLLLAPLEKRLVYFLLVTCLLPQTLFK